MAGYPHTFTIGDYKVQIDSAILDDETGQYTISATSKNTWTNDRRDIIVNSDGTVKYKTGPLGVSTKLGGYESDLGNWGKGIDSPEKFAQAMQDAVTAYEMAPAEAGASAPKTYKTLGGATVREQAGNRILNPKAGGGPIIKTKDGDYLYGTGSRQQRVDAWDALSAEAKKNYTRELNEDREIAAKFKGSADFSGNVDIGSASAAYESYNGNIKLINDTKHYFEHNGQIIEADTKTRVEQVLADDNPLKGNIEDAFERARDDAQKHGDQAKFTGDYNARVAEDRKRWHNMGNPQLPGTDVTGSGKVSLTHYHKDGDHGKPSTDTDLLTINDGGQYARSHGLRRDAAAYADFGKDHYAYVSKSGNYTPVVDPSEAIKVKEAFAQARVTEAINTTTPEPTVPTKFANGVEANVTDYNTAAGGTVTTLTMTNRSSAPALSINATYTKDPVSNILLVDRHNGQGFVSLANNAPEAAAANQLLDERKAKANDPKEGSTSYNGQDLDYKYWDKDHQQFTVPAGGSVNGLGPGEYEKSGRDIYLDGGKITGTGYINKANQVFDKVQQAASTADRNPPVSTLSATKDNGNIDAKYKDKGESESLEFGQNPGAQTYKFADKTVAQVGVDGQKTTYTRDKDGVIKVQKNNERPVELPQGTPGTPEEKTYKAVSEMFDTMSPHIGKYGNQIIEEGNFGRGSQETWGVRGHMEGDRRVPGGTDKDGTLEIDIKVSAATAAKWSKNEDGEVFKAGTYKLHVKPNGDREVTDPDGGKINLNSKASTAVDVDLRSMANSVKWQLEHNKGYHAVQKVADFERNGAAGATKNKVVGGGPWAALGGPGTKLDTPAGAYSGGYGDYEAGRHGSHGTRAGRGFGEDGYYDGGRSHPTGPKHHHRGRHYRSTELGRYGAPGRGGDFFGDLGHFLGFDSPRGDRRSHARTSYAYNEGGGGRPDRGSGWGPRTRDGYVNIAYNNFHSPSGG